MKRVSQLLLFLLLITAPGARVLAAQLELGGFGGWRFGGSFHDDRGGSHTMEPSGSWGGVLDLYVSPGTAIEILASRQETSLPLDLPGPAKVGITIDHYQIGGLKEYEGEAFRPFLAGLLGWSHIQTEAQYLDRFSVTLAGGAKYYLTPRIGLRGDIRCHVIIGSGSFTASVGPAGNTVTFAGDALVQGEAAAGIFLAFGGPRESSPNPRPLSDYH